MDRSQRFEVTSAGRMRKKYGLTAENRPAIKLDAEKVPVALLPLIPLAEHFGIGDDLIRQDVVSRAPKGELEAMRRAVQNNDDAFDKWLAGPEARGPTYSAEYTAFCCLRMAADGC